MDIKAAVFDADGVLIKQGERFSSIYAKRVGISTESMTPFFEGPFKKCLTEEADLKEELKPFLKGWKWKGSAEEFLDYWFKEEISTNQELVDEIKELRKSGIKCYMASNQAKYRANYVIKDMGFERFLDGFFISCDFGVTKFQEEFFEKMYKGISPDGKIGKDEIAFWDDKQSIIDVAKGFGLRTFLYKDVQGFKKDLYSI